MKIEVNNEIMKRFLIDFFIILPIGFLVGTLAHYGATRMLVVGLLNLYF